jgi:predicted MFS family arabinose efflux permease
MRLNGRNSCGATMSSSISNPMDRIRVILSGVVISAIGFLFYNVLPLFLGTAQDFRELSDQAVGILSSAFYAGFTLTTSTAYFWIRKFNWRKVSLLSIPAAAAAMVLAGFAGSYGLMLTGIFLAGCAFSALYGIGVTVLGDTSQPARWYGAKIASEAALGAILLLILPGVVIVRWGFEGMMVAMAVAMLVLTPLLLGLPASGNKGDDSDGHYQAEELSSGLRGALWLALAAVMIYVFSTTMIWAFVERVANDAGFDPVATGNVLSLTLVFAVAGSILAVWMGERFGAGRPFAGASMLLLASFILLGRVSSLFDYGLAACVYTFSFGLGIPYAITIVAELDADGRYVVLTVPAVGIGIMAAPALGGFLTGTYGYESILWVGGIAVVVALTVSILALRLGMPIVQKMRAEKEREALDPLI